MDLGLLYSGGKDSTLAALLLEDFYDVTLVTATFGLTDAHEHACRTAERVGFEFETVGLDEEVAGEAVEQMVEDGYPRNGIQRVHLHALEVVAGMDFDAVADGTRRDDRVPSVSRAQAQSLEDRHGVEYIVPLAGFGRGAVDSLVAETLDVRTGPSEEIPKADYEDELRELLADEHGEEAVSEVFPDHTQTCVRGFARADDGGTPTDESSVNDAPADDTLEDDAPADDTLEDDAPVDETEVEAPRTGSGKSDAK